MHIEHLSYSTEGSSWESNKKDTSAHSCTPGLELLWIQEVITNT